MVHRLLGIDSLDQLVSHPERGFWNAMTDTGCDRAFVVYPGNEIWPMLRT